MLSKKWFSFLLALAAAISLWVYVVTYENQEVPATIYNIPVVFIGEDVLREDYDLLIDKDSLAAGVDLTFYGKLSEIKKLQSDKADIRVELDVSALIRSARDYSLNYDISDVRLPASVASDDISLKEQNPRLIDFTVTDLVRKYVEVKVAADLKLSEGYLSDPVTTDHKEIMIEGPKDLVDQVDYALVTLSRENVDQTISTTLNYTLMSREGDVLDTDEITSEVTEILVTVPVIMFKDVNLIIDVTPGGGIGEDDYVIDINPKKIRLSGEKSVLDAIDHIKLEGIDLATLSSNKIVLDRSFITPVGCENLSGTEDVTVTIEVKNKTIKTLRIPGSTFQFVGVPEGYNAVSSAALLSVSLRANTEDIDQIQTSNIRIVVDLSGVTVRDGAFSVKVPLTIYIDGFEDAGTIGDYSVVVDLIPILNEPDAPEEAETEE